jgi:hypothetical protein
LKSFAIEELISHFVLDLLHLADLKFLPPKLALTSSPANGGGLQFHAE